MLGSYDEAPPKERHAQGPANGRLMTRKVPTTPEASWGAGLGLVCTQSCFGAPGWRPAIWAVWAAPELLSARAATAQACSVGQQSLETV